jgi:hypothetical protein
MTKKKVKDDDEDSFTKRFREEFKDEEKSEVPVHHR